MKDKSQEPSWRRGLGWITVVLPFAATMLVPWQAPPWSQAARERRTRHLLLEELQLVALKNCTLSRIGSPHDGGYLMCANLMGELSAGYSYGVGENDDWGCEISTGYQVPVHQYDCFNPTRPDCPKGTFVFHNECLGERRERVGDLMRWGFAVRQFDTLTNQVAANDDSGKRLVVKIDIEGAEWDALMATPDAVLERIDQLPMELHGVNEPRFVAAIQKLKRTFYLVNLHFNNFMCTPEAAPLPADTYQVLFVNKRVGVLDAAVRTPLPSALNAPDDHTRPECPSL